VGRLRAGFEPRTFNVAYFAFTPRDSNPGIPAHYPSPGRRFNPGISGLCKMNKMLKFCIIFARKILYPKFLGQFPALKLRVSVLDPNTDNVIMVDIVLRAQFF